MARGFKTGGKDFEKGNKFGKLGGGRPPTPDDVKEAKNLNRTKMIRILNKFLDWPLNDLVTFVQDKNNPVLEVLVARVLVEGIKKGDQTRLNFLLDRTVGKVVEKFEFDGNLNLNSAIVALIEDIENNNKNGGK